MFGGGLAFGRITNQCAQLPRGLGARRAFTVAWLSAVGVVLASCGGEPRLVPPAGQPPSPVTWSIVASTPVVANIVPIPRIGDIVWAEATDPVTGEPIDATTAFSVDALRMIASVSANGLLPGSSIEATWEYNDTTLDAFATRLVTTDRAERSWVSFHIERDPRTPWPVGVYQVAISLDGTEVQRGAVEVTGET